MTTLYCLLGAVVNQHTSTNDHSVLFVRCWCEPTHIHQWPLCTVVGVCRRTLGCRGTTSSAQLRPNAQAQGIIISLRPIIVWVTTSVLLPSFPSYVMRYYDVFFYMWIISKFCTKIMDTFVILPIWLRMARKHNSSLERTIHLLCSITYRLQFNEHLCPASTRRHVF